MTADASPSVGRYHPRIRGEHESTQLLDGGRRIIPAYAGSTARKAADKAWSGDHPRIRGEHDTLEKYARSVPGSSPHTRGAHPAGQGEQMGGGIIPAYAGSTSIHSEPS